MRLKLVSVLLVAALAGLLATSAGAFPATSGSGAPTLTLHFLDISGPSAATIGPNQRPKLGDRFWFYNNEYRWNGTRRGALAGHVSGTAVFLVGQRALLTATAYLPGGTLEVSGEDFFTKATNVLPIIGGTGAFATARGEVITRSLGNPQNSTKTAITIRIWL